MSPQRRMRSASLVVSIQRDQRLRPCGRATGKARARAGHPDLRTGGGAATGCRRACYLHYLAPGKRQDLLAHLSSSVAPSTFHIQTFNINSVSSDTEANDSFIALPVQCSTIRLNQDWKGFKGESSTRLRRSGIMNPRYKQQDSPIGRNDYASGRIFSYPSPQRDSSRKWCSGEKVLAACTEGFEGFEVDERITSPERSACKRRQGENREEGAPAAKLEEMLLQRPLIESFEPSTRFYRAEKRRGVEAADPGADEALIELQQYNRAALNELSDGRVYRSILDIWENPRYKQQDLPIRRKDYAAVPPYLLQGLPTGRSRFDVLGLDNVPIESQQRNRADLNEVEREVKESTSGWRVHRETTEACTSEMGRDLAADDGHPLAIAPQSMEDKAEVCLAPQPSRQRAEAAPRLIGQDRLQGVTTESGAERSQHLDVVAGNGKGGDQATDGPETHRAGRSGLDRNVSGLLRRAPRGSDFER
ncbi:hypothetical protein FB451DRAFT_1365391 [Mycena latifolia]|nr:hypothetical protein FB451DRAFT_1365391 [Mycena latifolia]